MGIGAGVFLLAIGAVLNFAVDDQISGVDTQAIGVILMIAGALGIVLDLIFFAPRRRGVVTDTAPARTRTVVEERDARY
jgi:hypothetical protein